MPIGPEKCPECGSKNIRRLGGTTRDSEGNFDGGAWWEVTCKDCGALLAED